MPRAFDLRTPANDHDPLANLLDFAGEIDSTVASAGGLIKNFLDGMLNGVVEVIKELTGLDLSELATALESLDLSSPQAFVTSLIELLLTLPDVLANLVKQIINVLITLPDTLGALVTPLLEVLVSVPDDVLLIVNAITDLTGLDLSALGALDPVIYLQALQTGLGSLDLTSPTAFIESVIADINAVLGIDLGAIATGSVQSIIDAILGPAGFAAGTGDADDVLAYSEDLLAMLGGPALASGTFNAVTAVETFVTDMLHPTNLLAPLVGGTVPLLNIPALPIGSMPALSGYLSNLSSSGILALTGLASGALPAGVTAAITNVTGLGGYLTNLASSGAYNAAAGFDNLASSLLKNLTPSGANMGQLAGPAVAGALSNATIAGSALTSAIAAGNVPSLPAGWPGTIDGSKLVGSVAASIISGALANATLAGSAITGLIAAAAIPPITAAMAPALAPIDAIVNALGNPATNNTAAALTSALQNIPHPNVQGNLGSTGGLGSTIQNLLDQGVQAINNSSAVNNSIGLWYQALDNMGNFLGFNPAGTSPAGSIASTIASRAIQNNLWESIDPTTNGVFSLADIETLTTLPTIPVTAGNSVIGYINTRDGGVKQSIRWLGYTTGTLSSFILNLYSVNPGTGVLTNIFSSANIIGAVGSGSSPTWNAYNLAAANYLNAAPGNLYAVELVVAGAGTYNIVGKTVAIPAHPTAIPAAKGATRVAGAGFDAVGAGTSGNTNATTVSEAHTALGPVLAYVLTANQTANNTCTATYGGAAMTRLGTALSVGTNAGYSYYAHVFKLDTPAAGPQNVVATCPSGFVKLQTVSYAGATIGAASTANGTGTAMAHTVSSAPGAVVSQAFFSGASTTAMTGYNQTSRWNNVGNPWNTPSIIGDAPGAASVPFTANQPTLGIWGSIAVNITSTAVTSPATIASPNYSGLTPWFGLAGSAGATVFAPVMAAVTANGTINPGTLYPWANHFDVAVSGDGGGGAGGASVFGGNGGGAGAWATATLTKAQAGTSNWTITGIAAAAGGSYTGGGQPGTAGGSVSCAIPGYGNVTASGGAGGSGAGGQPLANPGASQPNKIYPNFYGVNTTFPGGAGGGSGQAPGGQPGGGGAGGNSLNLNGFNTSGGSGGLGIVYILAYQ